uniref:Galactosylgalactosylxylosylprotein 3-beta-glucuronosyltransferase n=1 Tax=Schistocephalus solidus TaxID=70667 RepID=A0A0X3Q4E0_SCHSO
MNKRATRLCGCFVFLLAIWIVHEAVQKFLQIPTFEDEPVDPFYLKKFEEPMEVLQNQTVYVITPTYSRLTQKADLVSLRSTLSNLDFIHWIVVEDAHEKTPLVTQFLAESSVPYTHLAVPSPKFITAIIRGSNQRNMGLEWLRKKQKTW